VSLASFVMASSSPRCEIRQLAVYVYLGGIKAHEAERHVVFYGRRGLPVKKPRFIPAQLAHQLARKLPARRLGTVVVLWAARGSGPMRPAAGSPVAGLSGFRSDGGAP
jgi:hypothetical protein